MTVAEGDPAVITSTDGYVSFVGVYNPVNIFSADKTNLYVADDNKLNYPWGDAMQRFILGSCRGHFRLNNGLTAGETNSSSPGLNIVMNYNDDATGIVEAEADSSFFILHSSLSEWYTLDGRRLSAQPTKPGLYLHDGKKVVVK